MIDQHVWSVMEYTRILVNRLLNIYFGSDIFLFKGVMTERYDFDIEFDNIFFFFKLESSNIQKIEINEKLKNL